MTVNDKFQKSGLEPEDEEDDEQQQTIGIQQLLDSKELKKKNVAPSISRTTSATAIPKPFGYDPHGRGAELVQRNKERPPHLRSSYALETVSLDFIFLRYSPNILPKFISGSDTDKVTGQRPEHNVF